MNHHHRKILHTVFAHPISANLSIKDVSSVLKELGGQIDETHTGKIHVTLNGKSANFSHAQHSLPKEEVVQIRKFLQSCEIDPERDYPI